MVKLISKKLMIMLQINNRLLMSQKIKSVQIQSPRQTLYEANSSPVIDDLRGKRPVIITVVLVLCFISIPFGVLNYILEADMYISNFGLTYYVACWITLIINSISFIFLFKMYKLGPIIYLVSQTISIIYTLAIGTPIVYLLWTIFVSIIFISIQFAYFRRMKEFNFK